VFHPKGSVPPNLHLDGISKVRTNQNLRTAAGSGAVWIANYGGSSVSRIDAETHQVTTVKLARRSVGIAVGGGAVWVTLN
jgi:hypothetical protein